ncbi:MAG TPA: YetF domain-containing protein [Tepidisphaeraceae bacterium]|nr:YetF domain-containing protein [Tepidisphaeraceae bacterium]
MSLAMLQIAGHQLWHNMFDLYADPNSVSIAEKILRPVIVYFFLLIGLRIAGKRELAQLNAFDLIVLLMLSNTIQNAIIGNDNSVVGGMIGAAALLGTNYLMVRTMHRYRKLDHLLEGHADILIRDGKILRDHLSRELITPGELVAAARKQGISSLHDVERCILEPTGTITFVQKRPTPEVSRHDEIMALLERMAAEIKMLRDAAKSGPARPAVNPSAPSES